MIALGGITAARTGLRIDPRRSKPFYSSQMGEYRPSTGRRPRYAMPRQSPPATATAGLGAIPHGYAGNAVCVNTLATIAGRGWPNAHTKERSMRSQQEGPGREPGIAGVGAAAPRLRDRERVAKDGRARLDRPRRSTACVYLAVHEQHVRGRASVGSGFVPCGRPFHAGPRQPSMHPLPPELPPVCT